MRAEPFAAQCEAGNVKLIRGSWTSAYMDELCAFPTGAFDDQVDASSGAFQKVVYSYPAYGAVPGVQRMSRFGPGLRRGRFGPPIFGPHRRGAYQ